MKLWAKLATSHLHFPTTKEDKLSSRSHVKRKTLSLFAINTQKLKKVIMFLTLHTL